MTCSMSGKQLSLENTGKKYDNTNLATIGKRKNAHRAHLHDEPHDRQPCSHCEH